MNCTKDEAISYIKQNAKAFGGTMTQKEIGLYLGVSTPRVNQIIKSLLPRQEQAAAEQAVA